MLIAFLGVSGRAPARPWCRRCSTRSYLLHFFAIVAGFSLAASVLFMRYRDLNQVWEVVTHAGFFVAPIIYPLDILPERVHVYLYVWPPTPIILFSRSVLVDGRIAVARSRTRCCSPRRSRSSELGAADLPLACAARRGVAVMPTRSSRSRGVSKSFAIPSVRRDTVREHALDLFRPRAARAAHACSTTSASSSGAARASA